MLETEFLLWLHLLGLGGYLGVQCALVYMLLPAAGKIADEPTRRAALITGFRFYNPFSIATLGVLVITGAVRLTDLKAAMKLDYFNRLGATLSLKLLLVFVLIFIQTYITFGLAFRIGRQEEIAAHGDGEPFTVAKVDSMLKRIRSMTWVTIVLTAAIVFLSIRMTRATGALAAAALSAPGRDATVSPDYVPRLADRARGSEIADLSLVDTRRRGLGAGIRFGKSAGGRNRVALEAYLRASEIFRYPHYQVGDDQRP